MIRYLNANFLSCGSKELKRYLAKLWRGTDSCFIGCPSALADPPVKCSRKIRNETKRQTREFNMANKLCRAGFWSVVL